MRVIAPRSGERSAHAARTPRCWKLEQRVRKKVVTTTFTYDNNGNVTQKTTDGTTTTYIYDYANRLTALGVGGGRRRRMLTMGGQSSVADGHHNDLLLSVQVVLCGLIINPAVLMVAAQP
jgi:YD repeat-containing protein